MSKGNKVENTKGNGDLAIVSGSDTLILLERKSPTKYEIHRGSIEQTKNLVLTTDDKEFAKRLVSGYNHYR